MSNNLIDIVSDYEYVLGQVQGNVLNLQAQFGGMGWLREELYIISKELENTGKMFAEKQGLRDTGTLIDSTHAVVDDNHHINFFNNANLGNGFYAGHIEYGHHTRNGEFVPARPFMRPALYTVAEASRGKISGALSRYLHQVVYGGMSLNTLEFGRAQISDNYTRVFYQQQTLGRGASSNTGHYTSSGLLGKMNKQDAFGKMASTGHRGVMSPIVTRDGRNRIIESGNSNRFMTQNPIGSRQDTSSTRRYQHYGKNPGRVGRPDEGKGRVPSGKGPGRQRIYPPGMQPSRQPTGRKRGRPAIYGSNPKNWPSRKPTGRKRGRPSVYGSNPKNWPSRQPTGRKRGRPPKNNTEKEKNLYNHNSIKKDLSPSSSAHEKRTNYYNDWESRYGFDWKQLTDKYSGSSVSNSAEESSQKSNSIGSALKGNIYKNNDGKGPKKDGVYFENGKKYYIYNGKRIEHK